MKFMIYVLIGLLILNIFWTLIKMISDKPLITIAMDSPEMLRLAMEYHGIESCIVDKDGVFYFIREGQWCSLYSIPFRKWYRERR